MHTYIVGIRTAGQAQNSHIELEIIGAGIAQIEGRTAVFVPHHSHVDFGAISIRLLGGTQHVPAVFLPGDELFETLLSPDGRLNREDALVQAVDGKDSSEIPGPGLFDIGDFLLYCIKLLVQLSRLGDILKCFTDRCKIVAKPPFDTLGYDHLAKEVCYIIDSSS